MSEPSNLEEQIKGLLADPQYQGHPLQVALEALFTQYNDNLIQIERLTSISDGYQLVLQERHQTLAGRYQKQLRQLQKIVRISDHYQTMLQDLNEALKFSATHDPLTGLANRRLMQERLENEAEAAREHNLPFSVAVIDIDHFKQINDSFGHDAGDKTLIRVANILFSGLRGYDVCARWGGEEFLVLFPETLGPNAMEIAERLRLSVCAIELETPDGQSNCTVCIGVAEHQPKDSIKHTINRADMALYKAKRLGRNQVQYAD